jgi:hypothetical protein
LPIRLRLCYHRQHAKKQDGIKSAKVHDAKLRNHIIFAA